MYASNKKLKNDFLQGWKEFRRDHIKENYFVVFVIFSGIPLFFLPNAWDALIIDYGFITENLSGVEIWYKESSSHFQLALLYLIFFLQVSLH